jgi:uncharacterized protein (DUF2062 family)
MFGITGNGIEALTNPRVQIESEYDQKYFRIRTNRSVREDAAVITVTRAKADGTAIWAFDLPVRVGVALWPTLGLGLVIGALLAAPQIVSAWTGSGHDFTGKIVVTAVAAAAGLFAGVTAAFGIQKSL